MLGIERDQSFSHGPQQKEGLTSFDVFWKALETKYGKASESGMTSGMWRFPADGTDCLRKWSGTRPPGRYDWPDSRAYIPGVERCATHLTFTTSVTGGIVNRVRSRLGNPLDQFRDAERRKAHFEQLVAEWQEKQAAKASAPPKL